MKTILICPNQAHGLTVLADKTTLPTLPILGDAFICHWMQWLAAEGFKEVRIVSAESAEAIREHTGDGSRWGVHVEIFHEVRDLQPEEARKRYKANYESDWAADPLDVIEANHLPGIPQTKIFGSHAEWFKALVEWLPIVAKSKRVGMREIGPQVWVGLRTKIARSATLVGPCWVGDHVQIGKNSVIGPNSFLEDQVVIDEGCSIENSWIGPKTFLGALAELKGSLAWGNLLINWKNGSHTFVPDAFLLGSLSEPNEKRETRIIKRPAEAPQSQFARRIEGVISLAQKLQS